MLNILLLNELGYILYIYIFRPTAILNIRLRDY